MFLDARKLDKPSMDADICIVGAGAAGITLALELNRSNQRVMIVEAGGFDFDRRGQDLYRGENISLDSIEMDESRFRFFGGSTNRWAGWCRPLEPIDFERRDWIPHSGWPISRHDLDPWYEKAARICELTDDQLDPQGWNLDPEKIAVVPFRLSPPTNFGTRYRDVLAGSPNVTVMLNANAVRLVRSGNGNVRGIDCTVLGGKEFSVSARVFVVAAGGIENARLLLASASNDSGAPGNGYGLVGRFYMDHPALFSGTFDPGDTCPPLGPFTTEHVSNPGSTDRVTGAFSLSESLTRAGQLCGAVVRFVPRPSHTLSASWESPGSVSARRLVHLVRSGRLPQHARLHFRRAAREATTVARAFGAAVAHRIKPQTSIALRTWVESLPDAENRVSLSARVNAIGPVARLEWSSSPLEKQTMIRLHDTLTDEFRRRGFGRIASVMCDPIEPWPASQVGASHHMGTTRMHDSPRHGVVDRHCRVHGCENLYMAGSSVFPTSGYANPTFTIVALAIRLASFLRDRA